MKLVRVFPETEMSVDHQPPLVEPEVLQDAAHP
jgi:hypothetical protein